MSDKYSITFKAFDEIDALTGAVVSGTDTLLLGRINGGQVDVYRITISQLKTALGV